MRLVHLWPILVVLAGALAAVPVVRDESNRAVLYWIVLPTIVLGAIAMCMHLAMF